VAFADARITGKPGSKRAMVQKGSGDGTANCHKTRATNDGFTLVHKVKVVDQGSASQPSWMIVVANLRVCVPRARSALKKSEPD